jgi:hypothetical protein
MTEALAAPEVRRRPRASDGTALIISLRGDDIALFTRVRAAIEARAGCEVAQAAVIRAALRALERAT